MLGIGAISGVQYLKYRYSDEYKAKREVEKLIEEYNNDPYGGETPEETLRLFIDALKKGDIDLAAKYFVMEKQEKWKDKFIIAKDNSNLGLYIKEVQDASYGKELYPGNYMFTVAEKGIAKFTISLVLTQKSKKWKIEDL